VWFFLFLNSFIFLLQDIKTQLSNATTSAATATLSNLNLSSKNFSEELANLASLTNSSDNILDNSTHASTNTLSISCDNHPSATVAVDPDLSLVGPSSVDSAVPEMMGAECNGTSIESHALSSNQNEEPNSFSSCSASVPNDNHSHQPASSASSTSSGNFSTSPSQQNVFESTAVSQSYLCTLSKNLENEISLTQQHLDDENDKRHKYKVSVLIFS
jgi:hypothetical protein